MGSLRKSERIHSEHLPSPNGSRLPGPRVQGLARGRDAAFDPSAGQRRAPPRELEGWPQEKKVRGAT